MSHTLPTLCCAALLLAATPAAARGATGATGNRSARAEALTQQGQVLLDAGRVDEACAKFEASETLANDLGTLLKLGDCYERAGRTASAWHTFLEAQAVAHNKRDAESDQLATFRVAALEPKLTRVVFIVPMTSRVPGLSVRLGPNTISPAAWGSPIPVDPGMERVSASAKGYAPWSVDLDASQAQGSKLRVNVPALNPLSMVNTDRQKAYRTAGIVTGGVGLAGLGAGAVFNALSSHSDDSRACVQGVVQCTPNNSRTPDSNKYANAAAVSFALGGALVATGVTLFVLAPAPDKQEKHALRIAARVAGTTGGRLQLEGAW
jgi:tetratricopeptide (TPR) repeat protein